MRKLFFCFLALIFLVSCSTRNNELSFFKDTDKSVRREKLVEDLNHFEDVMLNKFQKEHRNITDEKFKEEINNLKSKINNISDSEFLVEIQRIISLFSEGHVNFNILGQALLPIEIKTLDDGVYIIRAEKEYEKTLYSKIKYINGIDINEVKEKIKNIVSGDNKYNSEYWADDYINNADYLLGLEIINDIEKARFSLEKDGKIFDMEFKTKINRNVKIEKNKFSESPQYEEYKKQMKDNILKLSEKMTPSEKEKYKDNTEKALKNIDYFDYVSYLSKGGVTLELNEIPYKLNYIKNYEFKAFPESNTMLFSYNKCENDSARPLEKFSKEFFDYIKENERFFKTKNIIIDLRQNLGGSSIVFNIFLKDFIEFLEKNKEVNVIALVGRNTFSAGTDALSNLKATIKNLKIYGEEVSGGISSSGDVTQDILPNSKLIFQYGQNYFSHYDTNVFTKEELKSNTIFPDVKIKQSIKDYIDNEDYVLKKILEEIRK